MRALGLGSNLACVTHSSRRRGGSASSSWCRRWSPAAQRCADGCRRRHSRCGMQSAKAGSRLRRGRQRTTRRPPLLTTASRCARGGGWHRFNKCDLIAVDKYEGVPAITVSTHKEPIKMRLSIDEFWDDFYASRQL